MIILLNRLLWEGKNDSLINRPTQQFIQAGNLIDEILVIFGLPLNKGFENIMAGLGKTKEVSTQVTDEILIKLADEGIFYQTITSLS